MAARCLESLASVPSLIRCRAIGTIDHEHFDRPGCRFELESELFLECGEHRRSVWIDTGRQPTIAPGRRRLGGPRQLEIVDAGEAGAIDHRASANKARQVASEVRHWIAAHQKTARHGSSAARWTVAVRLRW